MNNCLISLAPKLISSFCAQEERYEATARLYMSTSSFGEIVAERLSVRLIIVQAQRALVGP